MLLYRKCSDRKLLLTEGARRAPRLYAQVVAHLLRAALAVVVTACTQAAPPSHEKESATSAPDAARTKITVAGKNGVKLDVEFRYQAQARSVEVNYQLHNSDAAPLLAVFDRGDLHTVRIGRQKLGAIGQPGFVTEGTDVEMLHAALPLPDPAPTSPPTPLAIKVAPGSTLSARFESEIWSTTVPKRLRWCVGVMPFDEKFFDAPARSADGQVWSAPFAAAEAQQMLCTPWFDIAKGGFES
ncbi:hypothetical protein [Lysobacter capsici]|uniref:hypothetical protein n=1 Tax=Lysobacter capsici TaxID=435897 RepID=UPI000BBB4FC5|nr:hypothetical protein [Lysobacter capsici]ATE70627.1 hypothetical protein CNO08_04160 [Lysobacter capsici]